MSLTILDAECLARVAGAANALKEEGVAHLLPEVYTDALPDSVRGDLADAWQHLPLDLYLGPGQDYRYRRYGTLHVERKGRGRYDVELGEATPFVQSAELIPMYKGQPRELPPASRHVLTHKALRHLLALDLEIIASSRPSETSSAQVGVHLIRVIARPGHSSAPAPERRHRDGHDYVAMHLVKRDPALRGGESKVYALEATVPFLTTTLSSPLEALVVDDNRVEHDVTPVSTAGESAFRDMLLIDFDRVQ